MANRRDSHFEERERWRDNPSRSQDWGPRHERESGRYGQWEQNEGYGERERSSSRNQGWEEPQRFRNEEDWGRRGERQYGQQHLNQGAADYGEYRDRPYSGSSSCVGHGGYAGHGDPYVQGRERGYGASSTGAGWGGGETGRHRLGSLTESAASSAQNVIGGGYYGESGQRENYPSRISNAGKGPKGYRRSDDRIREEVCELLTRNHDVDATNIEVTVHEATVVLSGTVDDRRSKRIAEDVAQEVSGARDVQNQIRVEESGSSQVNRGSQTGATTQTGATAQSTSAAAGQGGSGGILGLGGSGSK